MIILLTNDDGIDAPGINALYQQLIAKHEVWMIAPRYPVNAISHAITIGKEIRVEPRNSRVFAVYGTPADCVLLGVNDIMPYRPELVVSGINAGPNLGDDVTYSGTVGAAMEGVIWGITSISVSMMEPSLGYWQEASIWVDKLIACVKRLPQPVLLNINIPPQPKGVKVTRLGKRTYENIVTKKSDYIYVLGGNPVAHPIEGTDMAAVSDGYIAVTPLKIDITDDEILPRVRAVIRV